MTRSCSACGEVDAVEHLAQYFTTDLYTGRWFERLEGGGDQPAVANRLTGADLAALPLLSLHLTRGDLVIDLLERRADEISVPLAALPGDVPMHEAPWELLAPGSAAMQLWDLLRTSHGVERVVASKCWLESVPT